MSELMQSVDERTPPAGANRLEVLLFSLGQDSDSGREEVFGINVFKVREVMRVPEITRAPDMPSSLEGMVSLRGITIPVINLTRYCGISVDEKPGIMIITEYNKHIQGFLVHSVDSIRRLAWEEVKAPPAMMASQHGGLVTAVTEVEDNGLVMIMDVEKVLSEAAGFYDDESIYDGIPSVTEEEITVMFVDDSSVARGQIQRYSCRYAFIPERRVQPGHGRRGGGGCVCREIPAEGVGIHACQNVCRAVEVMPDWRFAPTTLSVVYPSNRNLLRIVRQFKDFCIEHIGALTSFAGIQIALLLGQCHVLQVVTCTRRVSSGYHRFW